MSVNGIGNHAHIYNSQTKKLFAKNRTQDDFVSFFNGDLDGSSSKELDGFGVNKKRGIESMIMLFERAGLAKDVMVDSTGKTKENIASMDETEKATADYIRISFSSNNPEKLDKVFYTWYSSEGMKCIWEGERNFDNPEEKIGEDELQWEIKFDSPEQYDKLKTFLEQFPKEDNLRFAANEAFWNDFFSDEIDMAGFMEFYEWTDGGEPDFGMGENGKPTSLNKERIKNPNAKYFNDQTWIGQVWTEEEMWAMWYARMEASGDAQKAGDSIPVGGAVTGGSKVLFSGAAGSENMYFKYADERGIIDYNGIIFYCDAKTDTLKLGDCSNSSNCIQIPLAEGGCLMVNRDNLEQLLDALSLFSSKDMLSILETLQKERRAENFFMEKNKEQDEILELVNETIL